MLEKKITAYCEEIEKQYGRAARRRFERLLENNSTDHELSEQEIQAFRERFEHELEGNHGAR